MLLEKEFYNVTGITEILERKYEVHITLNKDHDIFKGHFPGNPVTPGACMIQIIKEITQRILGTELFMKSTSNVKFMALINPEINAHLKLELEIVKSEEGDFKVKNTTSFNDVVALKMSNVYSIVSV